MSNILCQECGKKRDLFVLNYGLLGMKTRYVCKECRDAEDAANGWGILISMIALAIVIFIVYFR